MCIITYISCILHPVFSKVNAQSQPQATENDRHGLVGIIFRVPLTRTRLHSWLWRTRSGTHYDTDAPPNPATPPHRVLSLQLLSWQSSSSWLLHVQHDKLTQQRQNIVTRKLLPRTCIRVLMTSSGVFPSTEQAPAKPPNKPVTSLGIGALAAMSCFCLKQKAET